MPDYAYVPDGRMGKEIPYLLSRGRELTAIRCGHAEPRRTPEFLMPEEVELVVDQVPELFRHTRPDRVLKYWEVSR